MRRKQNRFRLSAGSASDRKGHDQFIEELEKLLFPPRCPVCDGILHVDEIRAGSRIHQECRKKLYPAAGPVCYHCGRPVTAPEAEYCYDCGCRLRKMESPYWKKTEPFSWFVQGKALYVYQGAARKMMYRFKYANRREYASFLAGRAVEEYGDWIRHTGVQAVVPVPVFRGRQKKRGYNQAGLLAKQIAELSGLAYEPEALIRIRNTRPQKELGDKERKNNLKSAFQAGDFVVKYRCILLVDDIYTTGATVEAAAQELRKAGVSDIYVLTICIGMGINN